MMTRIMRDTAFGPFGLRFGFLWLSSGVLLMPSRLERKFVSSTGEMLTRKCERQLRSLWLSTRTSHDGTVNFSWCLWSSGSYHQVFEWRKCRALVRCSQSQATTC
jgi:hypothetical protein